MFFFSLALKYLFSSHLLISKTSLGHLHHLPFSPSENLVQLHPVATGLLEFMSALSSFPVPSLLCTALVPSSHAPCLPSCCLPSLHPLFSLLPSSSSLLSYSLQNVVNTTFKPEYLSIFSLTPATLSAQLCLFNDRFDSKAIFPPKASDVPMLQRKWSRWNWRELESLHTVFDQLLSYICKIFFFYIYI